jgi:hypothetical protein
LHKSITVKLNLDLLDAAVDLWYKSAEAIRTVPGHIHTLVIHPLPLGMLQASSRIAATSGGPSLTASTTNFLGLNPKDGPLAIVQICTTYSNAKDDHMVANEDTKYLDEVARLAREMGLQHPNNYIFANYAWPTEPVIAGYGQQRVAVLRKAALKYDPDGFFQGQFVGGFKIGR